MIFTPKGGGRSISVQVKSRFTLGKRGNYQARIRKKNFSARKDLYVLFVYYDSDKARLAETVWFVPSIDFEKKLAGQSPKRKSYAFSSRFTSQRDMWKQYQLRLKELPEHILRTLGAIRKSGH